MSTKKTNGVSITRRALVLGAGMAAAYVAAEQLKPTIRLAEMRKDEKLDDLVGTAFGDWVQDNSVVPLQVDPATNAQLASIYSQTLAKTFRNAQGERVMLSLAYGGDQNRELQVHRPEVCYSAQGFRISSIEKSSIDFREHTIPVMHLVADRAGRSEPITYWLRIGESLVRGNIELGLSRLRHGLKGQIPDGLLVRVSTLDTDKERAFRIQAGFVEQMLAGMNSKSLDAVIGPVLTRS